MYKENCALKLVDEIIPTYLIDVFSLKIFLEESKHVGVFDILIVNKYVVISHVLLVVVS